MKEERDVQKSRGGKHHMLSTLLSTLGFSKAPLTYEGEIVAKGISSKPPALDKHSNPIQQQCVNHDLEERNI